MAARLVTIQQCNDEKIIVYFDADVIIHAIKDANSPQLEHLLRVEHALRRCSTTTMYEVAFARKKGDDLSRLKKNQAWINDHFPDRDRLDERVAEELERSLGQLRIGAAW